MVDMIYKEEYNTLLHTKYESSGLLSSEKKIVIWFSNCKSMEAVCCHGSQISDPNCFRHY